MMLTLQIRRAEVAMADGRLDEAYQQAIREEVRSHRRGQRLVTNLVAAYQKRASQHLQAGDAVSALSDANRATRLGGNQPELAKVRQEAISRVESDAKQRQIRRRTIDTARRYIAAGDLSLGQQLCENLDPHETTVVGLLQDAERQRQLVEQSISRARGDLAAQRWEDAIESLLVAHRTQPHQPEVQKLRHEVARTVSQQARKAFALGRLDQATSLLGRLDALGCDLLEIRELQQLVEQSCRAASFLHGTNLSQTVEKLKSLRNIAPDAEWLESAISNAETAARNVESLRTGPLGLVIARPLAAQPRMMDTTMVRHAQRPNAAAEYGDNLAPSEHIRLGERFVMHVDGAGSFFVVRARQLTLGPQSRSRPVDLALLGNVDFSQLTIERVDEDYFLSSEQPINVNGKNIVNTLLGNQDEIRLGRRGGLKFKRPCPASTSAVLEFQGIRLSTNSQLGDTSPGALSGNTRRVLMMDDSLVFGPQPTAHVQVPGLERTLVLHCRDGKFFVRPTAITTGGAGVPLVLGRTNDLDGMSLVVNEIA